ncbi:DUF4184 family protein [Paenibacillus luteus]|uniref:DUF4184 family protein n=1 Tax=Paenibacillus luteus TaxID=2545753 RepID=UPI001144D07C|nr:DUF4184 family protein [Paenibacillus luteus]
MPYTLAHPLFAAPLRKIFPYLSLTGLILGSMGPDMEYFIAMQPFQTIGHSFAGFLLLVLPMCVAFALAFHKIIKPSLPDLLPNFGVIRAYASFLNRPWHLSKGKDWLRFIISLYIGFLTHVFVDHFTHSSGWFVQRLPFLQSLIMGDYVYHILQMSFSLLGLAAPCLYLLLSYSAWRKKEQGLITSHHAQSPLKHWGLLLFPALALFTAKLMGSGSIFSISIWAVAPITSALFGLYAASLLLVAAKNQKIMRAIFVLIILVLLMGFYKYWSDQTEFSISLWVLYQFGLSTVIATGAILCHKNPKFNDMNYSRP